MRVRRVLPVLSVVLGLGVLSAPSLVASAATTSTTTSTTTTVVPTTVADSVVTTTSTTTTSTTTTTLPSAVTTLPEGCPAPEEDQAVFVGKVVQINQVAAIYDVQQIRAGTLDGFIANNRVEVRYGLDAKFLKKGEVYLVGAATDSATSKLASTVRQSADLFGGNDVAGAANSASCPTFEAANRTLHLDGTSIDSGVFRNLLSSPLRLILALVLPSGMVFVLLLGLVSMRRASRGAPPQPAQKKSATRQPPRRPPTQN
jgi:hypothetical protein